MKKLFTVLMTVIALASAQSAFSQTSTDGLKHFSARGLSFDYPATIELDDHSSETGQHLVFQGTDRAQIMIVSRFTQINSATQLANARREVVDTYVETVWQQIHEQDPNASRTEAQIEVAGQQARGVKLRAVLNEVPGNAEIYSLQIGPRLVVLSLIGSDKEIAASVPAWLAIRRSLKIEVITISAKAESQSPASATVTWYVAGAIIRQRSLRTRTHLEQKT